MATSDKARSSPRRDRRDVQQQGQRKEWFMSEENMSDSYEVGYGKPPKTTQFKKGSSGNPKGRPKKIRDFDLELLRQSRETIVVNVNGRPCRISKHEAVSMQLINKAASGDLPALRTYVGRHEVGLEKEA